MQYQSEFQCMVNADSEKLVLIVGQAGALDDGAWRAESTSSADAN